MKRILIVLALSLSLNYAVAQNVSRQQALQTAQQFMAERGKTLSQKGCYKAPRQQQGDEQAYYYVFDATDNQGFVIVAGDEHAMPILGYADHGSFDEENLPDGMQWLLENYRYQMNALAKEPRSAKGRLLPTGRKNTQHLTPNTQHLTPNTSLGQRTLATNGTQEPYHAPRQARHAVEPLMTTLWNQGEPYNIMCPRYFNEDGTIGEHSATGCVATALAQVVAYYRWPEKLKKSIPGYIQTYNTSAGEKRERRNTIPVGTAIDWDNMLDNYSGQHTAKQDSAVALLMLMVGVDCKMSYGASSASGYSEGVDGLINYFDFDDGTHIEKREWYTLHAWDEMIYNEIASGHPVPYGGMNTGGGHAFVLDGYSIDGLYHVNWGWGGMCDGYFRIDILDPDNNEGIGASQTPGGYNMGQDCILGMKRPDGIKDNPPTRHRLSANDWEIRDGNKFFCNFVNWTGVSASWNMGIGYINDEGELTPIGNTYTEQISPNYYIGHEFTVKGLKEGIYHVVPICKRSTDTRWVSHDCPERHYVYTEVGADGQVVKMEIRPTEENIEVTNFTVLGNLKRGDNQKVSATFRNNGEDEYFKEIHLLASRTQQKGEAVCRTAIAIAHGEEATISLTFKPDQNGTWNVWLATDHNGNNVVAQGTLEVTDEGVAQQYYLKYATHTINNRSNGVVYGNQMQGKVGITNKDSKTFDGVVRLWLFKRASNGYFYDAGSKYVPMVIEPGKTAQASFFFTNLDLNEYYAMSILYPGGGDIEDGGLKSMGDTRAGIIYWNQNMTIGGSAVTANYSTPSGAIAVDMRGVSTVKTIRPNNNPNTLYVMDGNVEIPSGLEGKNIVRGGSADEINLVDNYGFYSPLVFTAKRATYTRSTPATGWEPIALPFAASNVPAGTWFQEFSRQDDDGTIVFSHVNKLAANIPYVVQADETFTVEGTDVRIGNSGEASMIVGTNDYRYEGVTTTQRLNNIYVMNDEGIAFVPVTTSATIKPFRAYFISTLPQEQRVCDIVINLDTEGIDNLPTDDLRFDGSNQSVNSKSVNNKCYDLQGRQIVNRKLQRGLYIVGGKKIVK